MAGSLTARSSRVVFWGLAKQHPVALPLGIALITWGHVGYTAFVVLGFVALFAILTLLVGLSAGLALLVSATDARKRRVRGSAFWLCYCATLAVGLIHGKHFLDGRLEQRFAGVVGPLDEYHREHGSYPDSLAAVVSPPPECFGQRGGYQRYPKGGIADSEYYCISCVTYGMNHRSYCSNQAGWGDWD